MSLLYLLCAVVTAIGCSLDKFLSTMPTCFRLKTNWWSLERLDEESGSRWVEKTLLWTAVEDWTESLAFTERLTGCDITPDIGWKRRWSGVTISATFAPTSLCLRSAACDCCPFPKFEVSFRVTLAAGSSHISCIELHSRSSVTLGILWKLRCLTEFADRCFLTRTGVMVTGDVLEWFKANPRCKKVFPGCSKALDKPFLVVSLCSPKTLWLVTAASSWDPASTLSGSLAKIEVLPLLFVWIRYDSPLCS